MNDRSLPENEESTLSDPQPLSPDEQRKRLTTWLQFPRRVIFLLLAFGVATILISTLPRLLFASMGRSAGTFSWWWQGESSQASSRMMEMLGIVTSNTLLLLGAALFLAMVLALVAVLIAVLLHRLEENKGPLGSILKGLGRFGVFGNAAMPVFALGTLLLLVFAVNLEWLPVGGMISPQGQGEIGDRLQYLILPALIMALLLPLEAVRIAVLPHQLGNNKGPLSTVSKVLNLLLVLGEAVVLVALLILIIIDLINSSGVGDLVQHLILPALVLSLFPAMTTAQAVTKAVTRPRETTRGRLWLMGLLKGSGTLLGQIGGLLSAIVLVEVVFSWPGIGRLIFQAVMQLDSQMIAGALGIFSLLVLAGRILAERFRWLERFLQVPPRSPQPLLTGWRKTARTVWVVVTLLLLLLPLLLGLSGLLVDQESLARPDPGGRLQPPSSDHLLGTDQMGRDILALLMRGALITLGASVVAAIVALIPSGLGGALTGFLTSRKVWWAESLSDLLLLGADLLLFIPAVPALIVWALLLAQTRETPLGQILMMALGAAFVLLPRAVRFYQSLWTAAPEQRKGLVLGLAGLGATFLGSLYTALALLAAVGFLGLGISPPTPTFGGIVGMGTRMMMAQPTTALVGCLALSICAVSLYAAADALVGYFTSKGALARLNE